jgi:hypothetical protein
MFTEPDTVTFDILVRSPDMSGLAFLTLVIGTLCSVVF